FAARFQRRFSDSRRQDYTVVQRRRQSGRLAQRHRVVARRALSIYEYGRPKRAALRARARRHAAESHRVIPGEGSDGMKVDALGNLYTTNGAGAGEVRITSPEGVRLG